MDIVSFDNLEVPPDLKACADALLREANGQDGDADDVEVDTDGNPPEAYRAFLAVDASGKVVGHLAAYIRGVDQGSASMTVGMIGNVATRKTFRRRGIAKSLVDASHRYFRDAGARFSILFAYDLPVYVSYGYRLMRDQVTFVERAAAVKTCVLPGSMLCELTTRPQRAGTVNLTGPPV
ncbi:GNAT family N-acetyltransferase [Rhodobacteraceae bacterium N5(2021)]|uniref:GNAT family N-acetyltransferase n=1 Tax=Gymnodinialimonas phycosphaerae TaxID=2841589 RepID=A0A975YEG8_9RHOB|nr:GNAT family N-acetyltransferase [Gymnodinialimonas phycosphaerae]MBY4893656.1 GNAT family N-acetyltransferase [Gymnodinialimonas phycosphaerae]